jgi:hypothetical protein
MIASLSRLDISFYSPMRRVNVAAMFEIVGSVWEPASWMFYSAAALVSVST